MPLLRSLLGNLGWKLAAVALAYVFWLMVAEEKLAIAQLEVPVRFEHLDPSLALLRDRPSSVVVRVQAAEPVIKEIQPLDVDVRIDLTGLGEGAHLLRLDAQSPWIVPRKVGVKIAEVYPSAFPLRLEPKVTVSVPVHPALTGEVAKGYEVAAVRVEPSQVRVVGPKSAVETTTMMRTREVLLTGRTASLVQDVWIDVSNPDVMLASEPRARVRVTIREVLGQRTLAEVPVSPVGGSFESQLRPSHTEVVVGGPELLLAQLTKEDVLAFVDLNGLKPRREDYEIPLAVSFRSENLRSRLRIKSVGEEQVKVRVLNRKLTGDPEPEPGGKP